jgi:hypothetical protein
MNNSFRLCVESLVLGGALTVAASLSSKAQSPIAGATEFVTVALVSDLGPGGGEAVIERRAAGVPKNLILLRADNADPAILATAVMSLFDSRRKAGDTLAENIFIRINSRRPLSSLSAKEKGLATAIYARLKEAPPQAVPAHGTVPALEIPLGPVSTRG